jgi:hypothetical protein
VYSALLAEYVPRAALVYSRTASDTGATVSATLPASVTRPVADTGSSVGGTLAPLVARQLADAGAAVSDALAPNVGRALSSTGSTVSATLKPKTTRPPADTAATVSESIGPLAILRALADVGASLTEGVDTPGGGANRTAADTGASVSATLAKTALPRLSDYAVARAPIVDTFTRTVASAWGTSDSGDAWTRVTGVASEFSTDGAVAKIATAVTNSSRYITVGGAALQPDVDISARFAFAALPVAQSSLVGVLARYVDTSNHYRAWLNWTTGGAVQVRLEKIVAGTITVFTTQPSVITGYVAGAFVWVRFQALGSTLRVKVWADGSSEPSSWTHSVVDTDFRGGGPTGVRLFHTTGNTSTPTLSVDDFTATPSISDSSAVVPRRALADALAVADAPAASVSRAVADAGASVSEALARPVLAQLADTAAAVGESVAFFRVRSRALADALALSDLAGLALLRQLASSVAVSDALVARGQIKLDDIAASVGDSVAFSRGYARAVADALAIADALDGAVAPTLRGPGQLVFARSGRALVLADGGQRILVLERPRTTLPRRAPRVGVVRSLVYRA